MGENNASNSFNLLFNDLYSNYSKEKKSFISSNIYTQNEDKKLQSESN